MHRKKGRSSRTARPAQAATVIDNPPADDAFDRHSRQLLAAVLTGRRDRVALLLDTGRASVSVADPDGTSALMLAAACGEVAIARDLLRRGAPVNQRRRRGGATALYFACQAGRADLASLLLGNQADPSLAVSGRRGGTPLMAAAQNGHADCVRALLAAGSAPDWRGAGADGATALLLACRRGRRRCAELLLAAGANPLLARRDGATPLSAAAQFGDAELCRRLLLRMPASASASATATAPAAVVGAALRRACRAGHTEAALAVLRHCGDASDGLHAAALLGQAATVAALLAAGASPADEDSAGRLPADCALAAGHVDLHRSLLAAESAVESAESKRAALPRPAEPAAAAAALGAGFSEEFASNDLPGEQGFTAFNEDAW